MFSDVHTPGIGTFLDEPSILDPGSSDTSETSIIQAKLNRRLGPEYVSQRPAPGGGPKLTYVEGWKIIGLANEVFGYNGWCSTVTKIETDFIDIDPESRKCSVGVTAVVKITLKDGTYHEDIGYGSGENIRSKGAALDKAKKEAVTDGVKRALRNFGNLLGLCLYEKLFTQEIVKIKPQLPKFDESDLHRREKSDNAPPSAVDAHEIASNIATRPLEDAKLFPAIPPQMRSANSKPSPLRNTILGTKALQAIREDERSPASSSRIGMSTIGDGPAHFNGREKAAPAQAQPRNPDIIPPQTPPEVQLLQSNSEQMVTSASPPRQPNVNSVTPSALKASDSDIDIYFNDEDNDALLAIEDSVMEGLGSCYYAPNAAKSRMQDGICDADKIFLKNEPSRSGTRLQFATATLSTHDNRAFAAPFDRPMSTLGQAIRASTVSLTATGVKRPADTTWSSRPQSTSMGSVHQQHRLGVNNGRREPLSDLRIDEGADAKRIKR